MKILNLEDYHGKFFQVLQQTDLSQIGIMTLEKNESSGGLETHNGDQVIIILQGRAQVTIETNNFTLTKHQAIIIPAHKKHTIKNLTDISLFLVSIYTPPQY